MGISLFHIVHVQCKVVSFFVFFSPPDFFGRKLFGSADCFTVQLRSIRHDVGRSAAPGCAWGMAKSNPVSVGRGR